MVARVVVTVCGARGCEPGRGVTVAGLLGLLVDCFGNCFFNFLNLLTRADVAYTNTQPSRTPPEPVPETPTMEFMQWQPMPRSITPIRKRG